jgi:hypothetical protein
MTKKKHKGKSPHEGLFLISCKLTGVAEVMRDYHADSTMGSVQEAFYGLSSILSELAEEIREIHDAINGG